MTASDLRQELEKVNAEAAFNRWAGFAVEAAEAGRCVLRMPWRAEFAQYSGFAHAGVIAGILDTACGFAAATELGPVLTSQLSISYLAPAVGDSFRVEARLVKGGRRQAFAEARLVASRGGEDKLVAAATAVLLRNGGGGWAPEPIASRWAPSCRRINSSRARSPTTSASSIRPSISSG